MPSGLWDLYSSAFWSDQFFNWDGLCDVAWNDAEAILNRAKLFVSLSDNQSCPFTAEWLARDYERRV